MLRFKQREHVGPVLYVCVCVPVWGSPIAEMLAGRMGGGFYGPSGIHVSILARLHPLCLGHIINVNSQSREAEIRILYEFAVLVVLFVLFDVVTGVPTGRMPADSV